jgi:CAAX protease family protein
MNSGLEPPTHHGESPPPLHAERKRAVMEAVFLGPHHEVRAGWRAAFYVALFLLFLIVLGVIAALFRSRLLAPPPHVLTPGRVFPAELAQAVCAIAAAVVMGRIEGRRFGEYGLPWQGAVRGRFWEGALWGIAQITVLVLLIRALGGYTFGGLALRAGGAVEFALVWAGFFLVVGVFEEFFFRGYLQFTLARGMGFWPAAILLSAGFGATHLPNPGEGPIGALNVLVIGMFFCLTLRRTGNLWFAVGLHAAYDFGETYLYSVPNSGLVMQGHLFAAKLHGPRWLTGGTIGPEGSVLSFVILAAMFVLFAWLYPGAQRRDHLEGASDAQS